MPEADESRILRWIQEIDRFNCTPGNGTTRQYLTNEDRDCRSYLKEEFEALGLIVHEDCIGNLYGTLPGTDPSLAPVWTGSHFDTVLNGGKFDGVAGVVAGMEALRLIREQEVPHKRDLTVVAYASEEPARFGIGCIGSRALAGCLSRIDLKAIYDGGGMILYDELKRCGYDCDGIAELKKEHGEIYCALELHIEQNRELEDNDIVVGLVKAICAPLNLMVTVTGQASHSGGTPMKNRRDALAAASEMCLALERIVLENTASEYSVGTVGSIHLEPGVSNVIPGKAVFTVDIRDCDTASKDSLRKKVTEAFQTIAGKRNVGLEMVVQNDDRPITCNPQLISLLEGNCDARKISHMRLISGAFHDSLFIGTFTPVAMLFVPSKNGLSHCPQEWTDIVYIKNGITVLADTLLQVSNQEQKLSKIF